MRLGKYSWKGLTILKSSTIDFSALPAGLVAITGATGAGKTSLVDGIYAALYRELPTRTQPLLKYCRGKDAYLDLDFTVHGESYRAKLKLDAETEKMQAYLLDAKTDKPVRGCNGKLTPYDTAIEAIVGSRRLMLSSAFSAQTKKGVFHEMPVADRKVLFIELLGLEEYPKMEAQAKDNGDGAEGDVNHHRATRQALEVDMLRRAGFEVRLQGAITDAMVQAERATDANEHCEKHRAKAQELGSQIAAIEAQLNERKDRIRTTEAESSKQLAALRDRRAARLEIVLAEQSGLGAEIIELDAKLNRAKERLANNRAIAARSDAIREAVRLTGEYRQKHQSATEEWRQAVEAEQAQVRIQREHQSATFALQTMRSTVKSHQEAIGELQDVPCGGVGKYAECNKILRSVEYKNQLPALQAQVLTQEEVVGKLAQTLSKNGHRPSAAVEVEARDLEKKLAAVEKDAGLIQVLEQSEGRIKELTEQVADLTQQREQKDAALTAPGKDPLLEEIDLQISGALEVSKVLAAWKQQVEGLTAQLEPLQREYRVESGDVYIWENNRKGAERAHIEAETLIRTLREQIDALADKGVQVETARIEEAKAGREASDWRLMQRACSKNGIPALAIDAAGPLVSTLVNDLLYACFSNRFTIDLRTQKMGAAGQMLEDFNIRVIDAKHGREGTIDDLSGGEKVIVGEAVALGIALHNKGKHRIETLIRDETTGSLGVEIAPAYVTMLQKARELGGFHQILFITHNPECAELADARIRVTEGQVTLG